MRGRRTSHSITAAARNISQKLLAVRCPIMVAASFLCELSYNDSRSKADGRKRVNEQKRGVGLILFSQAMCTYIRAVAIALLLPGLA